MRILLVVNEAASSVTPRTRVIISRVLGGRHEVEVKPTHRRGHATRLAMGAVRRKVDVVVVLGGDGTLNEVANGLVGSHTAMAVLPGGSTNVLARVLGLPEHPVDACLDLVAALDEGRVHRVGLGCAAGRYFTFHAGVGFDAAIVEQVERHAQLKRYLSHVLFAYCGFSAHFRHYDVGRSHFSVRITSADGAETSIPEGHASVSLNTNPYTYLGSRPFDMAPAATFDTPLSVVTLTRGSAVSLLGVAASALRGADHFRANRLIRANDGVSRAIYEAPTGPDGPLPFPHQIDGDFLGYRNRLEIVHHPACLDLVMGPGFSPPAPPARRAPGGQHPGGS